MQLNDHQTLQLLRTRINAALAAVGTELDITLNAGNCSYDAGETPVRSNSTSQSNERTEL